MELYESCGRRPPHYQMLTVLNRLRGDVPPCLDHSLGVLLDQFDSHGLFASASILVTVEFVRTTRSTIEHAATT